MANIVMCPKCECLTVQGNFCRGCGTPIKGAEIVEVPEDKKRLMGIGFFPGPKSNWYAKLWK